MNQIMFENDGRDFGALYQAETWLKENGFSKGRMERDAPIGIYKGEADIGKWSTLTPDERKELHGKMTGDFRSGLVVITLYDEKQQEVFSG